MTEQAAPELPWPPPRANLALCGHDDAEHQFARLVASRRLPHALLLTGVRGIGKATLAFRLARRVLAGLGEGDDATLLGPSLVVAEDDPVVALVAAGSHPNLMVLEPGSTSKGASATEIKVDEVRRLLQFLALTPAAGTWRVVIVDPAEALNPNATNALLKALEEPPDRVVFILVSHAPSRLLATVRSRCHQIVLKPLATAIVADMIRTYHPDTPQDRAQALAELARGSLGYALERLAAGRAEQVGDGDQVIEAFIHATYPGLAQVGGDLIQSVRAGTLDSWLARAMTDTLRSEDRTLDLKEGLRLWDDVVRVLGHKDTQRLGIVPQLAPFLPAFAKTFPAGDRDRGAPTTNDGSSE